MHFRDFCKKHADLYILLFLNFLSIVIFGIYSKFFLFPDNIVSILNYAVPLCLCALGLMLTLRIDTFDFSTSAIMGTTSYLTAVLMNVTDSVFLSILITVIIGCILGAINGILVAYLNLHSIFTTLTTSVLFTSIASYLQIHIKSFVYNRSSVIFFRQNFLNILPVAFILLCIILLILNIVFNHSVFGVKFNAIANNRNACILSGINLRKYIFITFLLSGLFAALGGIIITLRLGSGHINYASNQQIIIFSIGLMGAYFKKTKKIQISRIFLSSVFFSLLNNGMIFLNFSSYLKSISIALILILIMFFDKLQFKQRKCQ